MSLHHRFTTTALVIGLMSGLTANADVNTDLKICESISARHTRDRCFYAIHDRLSSAAPNTNMKWKVSKRSSLDDDNSSITISLNTDISIFGRPAMLNTASLTLRCKEQKPAVYIATGMSPQNYVYGPDGGVVTISFDKGNATRHHVLQSSDDREIRLEKGAGLINKMIQHRNMLLTFSPFNSSPAMATFNLRGLAEVVKPLKDTCKW